MNTWLLPDGINESLPEEAEKLEALRRRLIDLYRSWGYRLVKPPLVEYMESLRAGMGTQLDLQTFKITDQLNGRMMGIRADITPQVARIDAHRLSKGNAGSAVNRLCYIGAVLRTRSEQQGGSRSPVQVGAELYGHAGIESDFEIISLMLQTLLDTLPETRPQTGHSSVISHDIKDLVLDLGHVGIVNGLVEHVGLDAEQRGDYVNMLARKSIPEIDQWLDQQGFSRSDTDMLRALPLLSGSVDIIDEARNRLRNAGKSVLDALEHLQSISALLASYYPDLQCYVDLAELRGYAYHTGILYTVYLRGRGCSIAHGGRYDGIGEAFGNPRPAIGFSTDLYTLASLSQDADADENGRSKAANNCILAPFVLDKALDKFIHALRAEGERVIRQLDRETNFSPEQQGCDRIIEEQDGDWVVVPV